MQIYYVFRFCQLIYSLVPTPWVWEYLECSHAWFGWLCCAHVTLSADTNTCQSQKKQPKKTRQMIQCLGNMGAYSISKSFFFFSSPILTDTGSKRAHSIRPQEIHAKALYDGDVILLRQTWIVKVTLLLDQSLFIWNFFFMNWNSPNILNEIKNTLPMVIEIKVNWLWAICLNYLA